MSANSQDSQAAGDGARERETHSIRTAFAALPLVDRIVTLIKVEVDLVGDVAVRLADEASRVIDGAAKSIGEIFEARPGGAQPNEAEGGGDRSS